MDINNPEEIENKDVSKRNGRIKKLLYWGGMIFFVVWISTRAADFEQVVELVQQANWVWLIVAVILETLYLLVYSFLIHRSLRVAGIKISYLNAFVGYISAIFFSVATPFGGAGTFLYQAKSFSKGKSRTFGAAISAIVLSSLAFYIGFLIILAPSLILLDDLNSYLFSLSILAGLALLLIVIVMYVSILFANHRPISLKKLFFKVKRVYQKLGRISDESIFALKDDVLENNLHDFIISAKAIRNINERTSVIKIFIIGFLSNLLQIVILWTVVMAFGVEVSLTGLVITYSVFYLFSVISPTPQGIGFVEGLMQIILVSLGVPGGASFVLTIMFRALTAWYPIILGFVVHRISALRNHLLTRELELVEV